jgi:hypothetical protein
MIYGQNEPVQHVKHRNEAEDMPSSDTQWKPGQSGNPLGGKLSSKRIRLFKQLVEPRTEELVNQALSIALSDSKDRTKVLAVFLERVLPAVVKDNELPDEVELKSGTFLEQADHIKKLISDKHITPEQGQVLLLNLKTTAEIKYKEDLEKQVIDLQAQMKILKDQLKIRGK